MPRKTLALAWVGMGLAACSDSPTALNSDVEPGLSAQTAGKLNVAGRFIVTLKERIDRTGVAREHGVRPDYVYTHALTGFAGAISDAARSAVLGAKFHPARLRGHRVRQITRQQVRFLPKK